MLKLVTLHAVVLLLATGVGHALWGRRSSPWLARHTFARRFVQRPGWCCVLIGCVSFAISTALTCVEYPLPAVHDEFSYLLAGDTYARGRLANQTHPMWEHFESFHILVQPNYGSKYPPGQGLCLALGHVVAGHPIAGVILSCALAAAASCWMLQGWMPARWAFIGGLMMAISPGIQVNWAHSYWGGGLAMFGGCLLVGGMPRFIRTTQARYAVVMSFGIAILAITRPFEGLILVLLALGMLLLGIWRHGSRSITLLGRAALSTFPIFVATAVLLALQNHAITGSWTKSPYNLNLEQYAPGFPLFVWQSSPETTVKYRHAVMERFYSEELKKILSRTALERLFTGKLEELTRIWFGFLGVGLTIPLFALPSVLHRPAFRDASVAVLLFMCGVGTVSWLFAHYLAPGFGLLLIVVMQGCRAIRASRWWNGRIVWLCVLGLFTLNSAAVYATFRPNPYSWQRTRQEIADRLSGIPGRHLAIVRYAPNHNCDHEWVYNGADIDTSTVVWAREMDEHRNRRLVEYFYDRTAWLVLADTNPVRVGRYRLKSQLRESTPDHKVEKVSSTTLPGQGVEADPEL